MFKKIIRGIKAVSYTHLDVYKRQHFRLSLTVPYKLNDINGKTVRDFGDVLLMGQYLVYASEMSLKNESRYRQRIYLGAGIKAVSYTHLDVYKRQSLNPSKGFYSLPGKPPQFA